MRKNSKVSTLPIVCIAAGLTAIATVVDAEERRQMDSHEHGVTALNIAAENGFVVMELEGPAMNFVGFEHAPRTDAQKQAINDTVAALKDGNSLFSMSPAAQCELIAAESRHVVEGDHDPHDAHGNHDDDHDDHDDHNDNKSTHSEFVAKYEFACRSPGSLAAISVRLFDLFPLTTEVEASFVGADLQTFAELTPGKTILQLRR